MFIFTVNILNSEFTDNFCVKVRTFNVVPKIFMNANILLQLLDHFKIIIPSSIKITAVLILYGCASHCNHYIINKYVWINIIFVLFLVNDNHIAHPFDISVFKTSKEKSRSKLTRILYRQEHHFPQKEKIFTYHVRHWIRA